MSTEFAVGGMVRVVKRVPTGDANGMGPGKRWSNAWVPAMDDYIGYTLIIADIDEGDGVKIVTSQVDDTSFGGYLFPTAALEKITEVVI